MLNNNNPSIESSRFLYIGNRVNIEASPLLTITQQNIDIIIQLRKSNGTTHKVNHHRQRSLIHENNFHKQCMYIKKEKCLDLSNMKLKKIEITFEMIESASYSLV